MAGCIAVIQKRLLDGNVHSIPAWERARILDMYVCKTVKTTQLWDRDFMGALLCSSGHVCVCIIRGEFIFSCGCVCARVCVRVWAECSKINAHVHWVPLDANPGGQVELLLNAPPDAGRQSEIYFACRCA
jgi:hypothetical protein